MDGFCGFTFLTVCSKRRWARRPTRQARRLSYPGSEISVFIKKGKCAVGNSGG